jgi:hypothetical protein
MPRRWRSSTEAVSEPSGPAHTRGAATPPHNLADVLARRHGLRSMDRPITPAINSTNRGLSDTRRAFFVISRACAPKDGIAPATAAHARGFRTEFAADSLLEGTGFEPSVPRGKCPTLRVSAVLSAGIRSPCKSQRSGP